MIGQILGHYRILDKLGAGGMGEVYRAHDERLDRDVALKVLPAGLLADESARHRFRKEALALAKLNHPNIEAVYDFDTQADVDFLVMEYVPGVTLSDKLSLGLPPEKEVLKLGTQLAEGLAAAHEQGIVHRDLKPGNLRLTPDGRLKILDFGLAKLMRPISEVGPTASITESHAVQGTLPYMAPEQLRGELVDARTDLYAAGVVLYEMATGRRPFREKVSTTLTDEILHKTPPSPLRLNPEISPRLEEIILKCLEKEAENRYQSAKELGVDLRRLSAPISAVEAPAARRWWHVAGPAVAVVVLLLVLFGLNIGGLRERLFGPATTGKGKVMLAVLPFENLSGDPEQEYFSDGLTEEMIAQLGRLQPARLGVIARTSVMLYKQREKSISQIGRELGVDYIIEGSVRRDAGRVRITAQLIQVRDQTHLWAESYERPLADVFAAQSDVSRRVADSLAVQLLPAQHAALARAPTSNPEAHEAYLKGRFYWEKRGEANLQKALDYFQQAIEKDPTYALAYVGVADTYYILADNIYLPNEQACPLAKAAAEKALALDDGLAEAHASLGSILTNCEWNWAEAEREFRRAIEENQTYALAHHWYAVLLASVGRKDEAIAESQQARQLDPLSPRINIGLGVRLYLVHHYDEAASQLQKTIELHPDHPFSHMYLGFVYLAKSRYAEAIAEFQAEMRIEASHPDAMSGLGIAYAGAGRRGDARRVLEELIKLDKQKSVAARAIALLYAALGEKEEAFKWLETAYRRKEGRMFWLKTDMRCDSLRSDPRFQDLLRRMKFPP